jgi:WD40 repeat protein
MTLRNKFATLFLLALLNLIAVAPRTASAQVTLPLQWAVSPIFGPQTVAYSPNGKWVATGGNGGAVLCNAATGVLKNLEPVAGSVTSVAFSADSQVLATAFQYGIDQVLVQIWNVSTGSLISTMNTTDNLPPCLAFSPKGATLAVVNVTGTSTSSIQLWNINTMKQTHVFNSQDFLTSVAFSPDGTAIAGAGSAASGGQIDIWNLASGKQLRSISISNGYDWPTIAFSSNGSMIAEADGLRTANGVLRIWNASTGTLQKTIQTGATYDLCGVVFSPDDKTIAVCGESLSIKGVLELRNASTGALISELPTESNLVCQAVAFSPNGRTIAAVGSGTGSGVGMNTGNYNPLEFWSAHGYLTKRVDTAGTFNTGPIAFSRDGKKLACSGTHLQNGESLAVVAVYNAETGVQIASIETNANQSPPTIAISPTNGFLAIAGQSLSYDTVLEIRDTVQGHLIKTFDTKGLGPIISMVFSPDGKKLFASIDTWETGVQNPNLLVFDIGSGTQLSPISGPGFTSQLALSPDGHTLAYTEGNSPTVAVVLWDIQSNQLIGTLASTTQEAGSIAFSPDGSKIAVQGCDNFGNPPQSPRYSHGYLDTWDVHTLNLETSVDEGLSAFGGPGIGSFSPDGQYFFFTTFNNPSAISMANLSIISLTTSIEGPMVFNPEGNFVALGAWGQEQGVAVVQNPFYGLVSIKGVAASALSVTGGDSLTFTVTLAQPAPSVGAYVVLSSNELAATVQKSIVVPAGKTSATFTIHTSKVKSKTKVTLTAAAGTNFSSTAFTVQ